LFRLCIWPRDWWERGDNASYQRNRPNLFRHPQRLLVAAIYLRRQPNRIVREFPPIRRECARFLGAWFEIFLQYALRFVDGIEGPTIDQSCPLTHSMPLHEMQMKDQVSFWSYPINFCFEGEPWSWVGYQCCLSVLIPSQFWGTL